MIIAYTCQVIKCYSGVLICPNLNVAPPFRAARAGLKPGATSEIRTLPMLQQGGTSVLLEESGLIGELENQLHGDQAQLVSGFVFPLLYAIHRRGLQKGVAAYKNDIGDVS